MQQQKNEIDCWRANTCPPGTEKTADFKIATALEELPGIIALPQAWERMAGMGVRPDRGCTEMTARADEE
jgi:hypothetical protein